MAYRFVNPDIVEEKLRECKLTINSLTISSDDIVNEKKYIFDLLDNISEMCVLLKHLFHMNKIATFNISTSFWSLELKASEYVPFSSMEAYWDGQLKSNNDIKKLYCNIAEFLYTKILSNIPNNDSKNSIFKFFKDFLFETNRYGLLDRINKKYLDMIHEDINLKNNKDGLITIFKDLWILLSTWYDFHNMTIYYIYDSFVAMHSYGVNEAIYMTYFHDKYQMYYETLLPSTIEKAISLCS